MFFPSQVSLKSFIFEPIWTWFPCLLDLFFCLFGCQYKSKIIIPCIRVVDVVAPLSLSEGNTEAETIFYRTSYQIPRSPIFGYWIQKQIWVPPASSIGPCRKLWSGVYEEGIIETEGDNERTSGAGQNGWGTRLVSPDSYGLFWWQTVVRRPVQCCRER